MRWMVIDGVDCTGKTTLCDALSEHYAREGLRCVVKPEFSTSFVGKGISEIVDRHRFFRLDQSWSTPIADLMVLMADVFCKYEFDIESDVDIAVMDRGVLSAIAYQVVRLYELVPAAKEGDLADSLLKLVASASRFSRWPDCHFTLKISRHLMEQRAEARDGAPLSSSKSEMLMAVQNRMLAIGPHFRAIDIAVDGKSLPDLVKIISETLGRRTFGRR